VTFVVGCLRCRSARPSRMVARISMGIADCGSGSVSPHPIRHAPPMISLPSKAATRCIGRLRAL
jgi:hypothetical protein